MIDVAAAAAVAAARAAEFDELLAPERDAAVAAGAGRDIDLGFVEEFHGVSIYRGSWPICRNKSDLRPMTLQANLQGDWP